MATCICIACGFELIAEPVEGGDTVFNTFFTCVCGWARLIIDRN